VPGDDVGFARLTGQVEQLTATLQVVIVEPERCDGFAPLQLVSQLDGRMATGSLAATDSCAFEGTITFPNRGAWFVYAQFTNDDRVVQVVIPVSVSGTAHEFVTGDWLHAMPTPGIAARDAQDQGPSRLLPYALLGLMIGLGTLLGYRLLSPRWSPGQQPATRSRRSGQRGGGAGRRR
jgi:hypothetical protein